MWKPGSPADLAAALKSAADQRRTIRLGGRFTKDHWGGPAAAAEVTISTAGLACVLQYEPRDLTVSAEAGLPYADLRRILAANRQMVPLDPPWAAEGTVGGVVAANLSGPRRRLYGTARDMVIGMTFATLEGKLVQSGGMVVKNVAGLDMAKLMIGSFGTLAAIAVVNFKLAPVPARTRTFVAEFDTLDAALAERDRILRGVLQPAAIDLLNPPAARQVKLDGWALLVEAGGNAAVLERCSRELSGRALEGEEQEALWETVREFSARFLARHPDGRVVPIPSTLTGMREVLAAADVAVVARAGNGVCYAHYERNGPDAGLPRDFGMMIKVKELFDPHRLLNRGRLYGRI